MSDLSANQPRSAGARAPVKLTLCLLTWNEVAGCRYDVPNLPLADFEEVFAIDGGSTDGTVEYLREQGITVYQQDKRGYNQAYLSAFRRCSTDALVLYHPKGSVDPAEVEKFRAYFEEGYDLVVASRMIRGSRNEEDAHLWRPRKWFVLALGLVSSIFWRRRGPIMWDVLHGFRGMRKDRFDAIEPLETGLSVDLEMVVRGYRKNYRMVEFPIAEKTRLEGETHFKAFRTGKLLLSYLLKEFKRSA